MSDNRLNRRSSFAQFTLFVSLITIVSLKGFFRQDDVLFETYQKDFLFYQQVLAQQPKDKNKIYSLHEPDVHDSKTLTVASNSKHRQPLKH
jgi:hypothetical protein